MENFTLTQPNRLTHTHILSHLRAHSRVENVVVLGKHTHTEVNFKL